MFAILWTLFTSKSLIIFFLPLQNNLFLGFFLNDLMVTYKALSHVNEHIKVFVCFFW
jgi:hypothetical protein